MLKNLFVAIASAFVLGGCAATVPMATPENDAQAKQFATKSDVAGVYIFRNESLGKAVKLGVELDDKVIGQTGYNTYFYIEVAPGPHKVTTRAENTTQVNFNAIAGKLYFVWQEVKMGVWSARAELHLVDDSTGKSGVRETNLALPAQP